MTRGLGLLRQVARQGRTQESQTSTSTPGSTANAQHQQHQQTDARLACWLPHPQASRTVVHREPKQQRQDRCGLLMVPYARRICRCISVATGQAPWLSTFPCKMCAQPSFSSIAIVLENHDSGFRLGSGSGFRLRVNSSWLAGFWWIHSS